LVNRFSEIDWIAEGKQPFFAKIGHEETPQIVFFETIRVIRLGPSIPAEDGHVVRRKGIILRFAQALRVGFAFN
jgi:hypothetical protein